MQSDRMISTKVRNTSIVRIGSHSTEQVSQGGSLETSFFCLKPAVSQIRHYHTFAPGVRVQEQMGHSNYTHGPQSDLNVRFHLAWCGDTILTTASTVAYGPPKPDTVWRGIGEGVGARPPDSQGQLHDLNQPAIHLNMFIALRVYSYWRYGGMTSSSTGTVLVRWPAPRPQSASYSPKYVYRSPSVLLLEIWRYDKLLYVIFHTRRDVSSLISRGTVLVRWPAPRPQSASYSPKYVYRSPSVLLLEIWRYDKLLYVIVHTPRDVSSLISRDTVLVRWPAPRPQSASYSPKYVYRSPSVRLLEIWLYDKLLYVIFHTRRDVSSLISRDTVLLHDLNQPAIHLNSLCSPSVRLLEIWLYDKLLYVIFHTRRDVSSLISRTLSWSDGQLRPQSASYSPKYVYRSPSVRLLEIWLYDKLLYVIVRTPRDVSSLISRDTVLVRWPAPRPQSASYSPKYVYRSPSVRLLEIWRYDKLLYVIVRTPRDVSSHFSRDTVLVRWPAPRPQSASYSPKYVYRSPSLLYVIFHTRRDVSSLISRDTVLVRWPAPRPQSASYSPKYVYRSPSVRLLEIWRYDKLLYVIVRTPRDVSSLISRDTVLVRWPAPRPQSASYSPKYVYRSSSVRLLEIWRYDKLLYVIVRTPRDVSSLISRDTVLVRWPAPRPQSASYSPKYVYRSSSVRLLEIWRYDKLLYVIVRTPRDVSSHFSRDTVLVRWPAPRPQSASYSPKYVYRSPSVRLAYWRYGCMTSSST
ncbi:hypothetical protein J6590_014020 [Homalodisca vitripennis]|nr:hypothetical protein J6590_014020 [Homalodisca vitripennis]